MPVPMFDSPDSSTARAGGASLGQNLAHLFTRSEVSLGEPANASDPVADAKRLAFARWLVQNGYLNEGLPRATNPQTEGWFRRIVHSFRRI